jgi:nitroreductase
MEALEAIFTRRSIRKYTPEPIPAEALRSILKAGMYAPSARNQQPWHFIVISSQSVKEEIMKAHPYASMLAGAPLAILVCGDTELEQSPGYWSIDCSAATQNMLLAAHSLGIGAVWLGVHPRIGRKDAIKNILRLPQHIEPFALIALGYPGEKRETPDRWREDRIRYDGWSVESTEV